MSKNGYFYWPHFWKPDFSLTFSSVSDLSSQHPQPSHAHVWSRETTIRDRFSKWDVAYDVEIFSYFVPHIMNICVVFLFFFTKNESINSDSKHIQKLHEKSWQCYFIGDIIQPKMNYLPYCSFASNSQLFYLNFS